MKGCTVNTTIGFCCDINKFHTFRLKRRGTANILKYSEQKRPFPGFDLGLDDLRFCYL